LGTDAGLTLLTTWPLDRWHRVRIPDFRCHAPDRRQYRIDGRRNRLSSLISSYPSPWARDPAGQDRLLPNE
jgi:hypothetical protein